MKSKNNLLFLIILLCILAIGIGYAILTEQLTINNTVSYDAMKWNIGFTEAEDLCEELSSFINIYVNQMIIAWYSSIEETPVLVEIGDKLAAGESKQIILSIDYNELTEDILPADGISTSGTFYMDWEETETK